MAGSEEGRQARYVERQANYAYSLPHSNHFPPFAHLDVEAVPCDIKGHIVPDHQAAGAVNGQAAVEGPATHEAMGGGG